MVGRLLNWWLRQLLDFLPSRWRTPAPSREQVSAEVLPSGETVLTRQRGRVALRLRPGALLWREVELPLAAERDIAQVLRYEMDRLTPFSADEVYWNWRLLGRDRSRGRVKALLLLVPRRLVDATLDGLRRAGVVPAALESDDTVHSIPLAPRDPRQERRRQRALAIGAALCAALAGSAVVVPFVRQNLAAHRIERRIASLRPQVDRVDALRRRIAGGAADADVVAAQRAASGDPLAVLAVLTDALPDDTYLRELTLRAGVLTFSGQSAAPAKLIPALTATLIFRDPAFAAPVTRNDATRAELFSIRTSVVP